MVTLGFGFKSYVAYKYRIKKQKYVQKSNDFYVQLITKALPIDVKLKSNYHLSIKITVGFKSFNILENPKVRK